jgi:hypothetical protein
MEALKMESFLIEHPPECVEDIDKIVGSRVMHEAHFCIFSSLEGLAYQLSEMELFDLARDCWRRVTTCSEIIHPHNHHEKVIYYDHFAQVTLALGDPEGANLLWKRAYELSVMTCGRDTPATLSLLKLVETPPASRFELLSYYSHCT